MQGQATEPAGTVERAGCDSDADCAGELCLRCVEGDCVSDTGCCRSDLDCPETFRCQRDYGSSRGRCLDDSGNEADGP